MKAEISQGALTLLDDTGAVVLVGSAAALLGDGREVSFVDPSVELEWRFDSNRGDHHVLRLVLRNMTDAPLPVEQLRPLVAPRGYRGLPLDRLLIGQTGWQSWSRSHPPAPFAPNAETAAPPIRGPRLPHRRSDSLVAAWMSLLTSGDEALLLGFLSAEHQLGTIEVAPTQAGHALVAATELDGLTLGPGLEVVSEPLLVALGRPHEVLELYAQAARAHMHARPVPRLLTGWCSWYQLYADVSEADVRRNLASLAARRDQLPIDLIQLDDGYQHAVGDWLELNAKFPGGMPALVRLIREHGYLPGVWLAPFLLSARSHTFAQHPDSVVQDEAGQPLNALDNWGAPNYALDTTHPEALAWLEHVIHSVCNDWGYAYLKLDFVYAAAMRGRRYAADVTAVEAFRRGMRLIRRIAGDRFVLGCGAPLLPSLSMVDGMRIGSDVAAYWGGDATPDGPALANALRATLARGWMHGRWWANDPDCVLVRAHATQLTPDEVRAWASVVALSGGMVFVGDDVSRLETDRLALLSRLLPPLGQAADVLPPLVGTLPERLHLRVERAWDAWSIVGIANWREEAVSARFDPIDWPVEPGRYHAVDLWSGGYLGVCEGSLDLGWLPPHGLRLLSIHPDRGRPQVVGSTGHLLGEAMDLADERWDTCQRTLVLAPASHGPRARQGEFIVAGPSGALQRVPFATASPEPLRLTFSA